jgi:hypothetical protein
MPGHSRSLGQDTSRVTSDGAGGKSGAEFLLLAFHQPRKPICLGANAFKIGM